MSDEIDHIAQLQKHLYARDPENIPKRKFGILRPIKQKVDSTWGDTVIPKTEKQYVASTAGFRRFFVLSLLFFLIAAGAAAYSFFQGATVVSSKNVDLNVLGNAFVAGGEDLPIQIEVANKNSSDLLNVKVVLEYPKGTDESGSSGTVRVERSMGTVPSGKSRSESFSVVLYGEQGTVHNLVATVDYRLGGASVVFEKKQKFPVVVNSSPLKLAVDGPVTIAPGQPFSLTVRNTFTGDKLLGSLLARVEYPDGFLFQSATPAPTTGNNTWALGTLAKGIENSIVIKGKILGQEGDDKAFRVYIGAPNTDTTINTIDVNYNSALQQVRLGAPFMSAQVVIRDQKTDIASVVRDSPVSGMIKWKNESKGTIVKPVFSLQFSGADIDASTIDAGDGAYNPLSRTIVWSGENIGDLSSIEPGKDGQLSFSVRTTPTSLGDLIANLSVAGTDQDKGLNQVIPNIDSKTIRFTSRLQFAATALYSIGPFKNTGPFPPQVNNDTTYTITWRLQPTDNPLGNIQTQATLAPGVIWVGAVSPKSEQLTYLPESRSIVWNVNSLPKATNIAQFKTVSFQVKVRPTNSQAGIELPLVQQAKVTGFDTVANVTLSANRPAVTTRLDTDPAYGSGKEKVLP